MIIASWRIYSNNKHPDGKKAVGIFQQLWTQDSGATENSPFNKGPGEGAREGAWKTGRQ